MRQCLRAITFTSLCVVGALVVSFDAGAFQSSLDKTQLNTFITAVLSNRDAESHGQQMLKSFQHSFSAENNIEMETARLKDRIDYILFLESRVRFFNKNNNLLTAFLLSHKSDSDITEKISTLDSELERIINETSMPLENNFQEGDIEALHQVLKKLESMLVERIQKFQSVNDGYRSLKVMVIKNGLKKRQGDSHEYEQVVVSQTKKNLSERKNAVRRQNAYIQELQQQIDQMKLGLDMFKERLQDTNGKVDHLTKEVATASLDLYETQKTAADKGEQAVFFKNELSETKERLRLVQHIIQEKDDHIQTLEEEMLAMQEKLGMQSPDSQLVLQLRGEVNSRVDDLQEKIEQSRTKIVVLEERFREMALKNAHLESELLKRNSALSILEQKVVQKDGMIADLEKGYKSRDQKVNELKGIVKLYQLKLLDYKTMLLEEEKAGDQYYQQQPGHSWNPASHERANQPLLTIADLPASMLWSSVDIQASTKKEIKKIHDFQKQ